MIHLDTNFGLVTVLLAFRGGLRGVELKLPPVFFELGRF